MKGKFMLLKQPKFLLILLLTCFFSTVYADECFVLYKAKKDNPLKLHLGLMQVKNACLGRNLESIVSNRLNSSGWLLLKIVNITENIETEKMKSDLGDYFFKY
jgi:hypothetical protein